MKRYKLPVILFLSSSLLFSCSQSNESSTTEPAKKETAKESSQVELNQISTDYRTFAIAEIDEFVKKTEEFANAVIAGDVEKAKELYAPARMHYERSEPIAEAFAELDPKIDAREGDVPDAEWGGYHRIEKGLWVENTTKGYEKYAEQLIKDVKLLRAKVETVDVTPDLLITGAVDLLNEVSTSKVTGEEDRYSHTDLYDFVANVEGAEKIYELMSPALKEKDEALAKEIEQRFQAVYALLDKYKKGDGYISYTELTKDQVKELSQSINELAEPLSKLGVVLEG
ncbi:EfeM/EfeO family lipoprotein [Aeribacillus pallidus]|uniref:iron uptake system protein EfeO n=1 Tax=Aeribacillus TaxID=1055323 RepID=UPI0007B4C27B|nr:MULTISPECIES: iron uptake system protein EfeO [Aeribacillus]KZM53769.1 iron ABC transporter substrate-binding protein [Aeribacillus pallidus]MED0650383.1 EfeM/EfeO family lipoprotein [Aeribacillus composti]MED4485480.1 EfeM/EfeO family lipoprotein [Aeribacillus pallidus]